MYAIGVDDNILRFMDLFSWLCFLFFPFITMYNIILCTLYIVYNNIVFLCRVQSHRILHTPWTKQHYYHYNMLSFLYVLCLDFFLISTWRYIPFYHLRALAVLLFVYCFINTLFMILSLVFLLLVVIIS